MPCCPLVARWCESVFEDLSRSFLKSALVCFVFFNQLKEIQKAAFPSTSDPKQEEISDRVRLVSLPPLTEPVLLRSPAASLSFSLSVGLVSSHSPSLSQWHHRAVSGMLRILQASLAPYLLIHWLTKKKKEAASASGQTNPEFCAGPLHVLTEQLHLLTFNLLHVAHTHTRTPSWLLSVLKTSYTTGTLHTDSCCELDSTIDAACKRNILQPLKIKIITNRAPASSFTDK